MIYNVVLSASYPNAEYKDYSQKIIAILDGVVFAEHYDDKHNGDDSFFHYVLEKEVYSESGCGAILKFQKWKNGLLSDKDLLKEGDVLI